MSHMTWLLILLNYGRPHRTLINNFHGNKYPDLFTIIHPTCLGFWGFDCSTSKYPYYLEYVIRLKDLEIAPITV